MKKHNFLRKLLALTLAMTMTLAISISAAASGGLNSYEENEDTGEITGVSSIAVSKTLSVDENVIAPATTFEVTISNGSGGGTISGQTVKAGVEGGLYVEKTETTDSDGNTTYTYTYSLCLNYESESENESSYSYSGNLSVDLSVFEDAGIYEYIVKETSGTYDGITYDSTIYYVYIYVEYDDSGNLFVAYVVTTKEEYAVDTTDTDESGNVYKSEIAFDNTYDTGNLKVSKSIVGNQADPNATFEFTLVIAPSDKNEKFYVVVYNPDGSVKTVTDENGNEKKVTYTLLLENGYTVTIELGDGDYFVVYGLSENDTFDVTEVENSGGYTPSYTVTNDSGLYIEKNGTAGKSLSYWDGTTEDGEDENELADDVTVAYVNTKEVTTPTGVVLNCLPYLLLLACAGGIGIIFFRRRRASY